MRSLNILILLSVFNPMLYSYEAGEELICEVVLKLENGRFRAEVDKIYIGEMKVADRVVGEKIRVFEYIYKTDSRILLYHKKEPSLPGRPYSIPSSESSSWRIRSGQVVVTDGSKKKLVPLKEFVKELMFRKKGTEEKHKTGQAIGLARCFMISILSCSSYQENNYATGVHDQRFQSTATPPTPPPTAPDLQDEAVSAPNDFMSNFRLTADSFAHSLKQSAYEKGT